MPSRPRTVRGVKDTGDIQLRIIAFGYLREVLILARQAERESAMARSVGVAELEQRFASEARAYRRALAILVGRDDASYEVGHTLELRLPDGWVDTVDGGMRHATRPLTVTPFNCVGGRRVWDLNVEGRRVGTFLSSLEAIACGEQ